MTHLLTLSAAGDDAVADLMERFRAAGLRAFPTFRFRETVPAEVPYACADHQDGCDCDLLILLVYGAEPQPATLVAHSHGGHTWLSLSEAPPEQASPELSARIKAAIALPRQQTRRP